MEEAKREKRVQILQDVLRQYWNDYAPVGKDRPVFSFFVHSSAVHRGDQLRSFKENESLVCVLCFIYKHNALPYGVAQCGVRYELPPGASSLQPLQVHKKRRSHTNLTQVVNEGLRVCGGITTHKRHIWAQHCWEAFELCLGTLTPALARSIVDEEFKRRYAAQLSQAPAKEQTDEVRDYQLDESSRQTIHSSSDVVRQWSAVTLPLLETQQQPSLPSPKTQPAASVAPPQLLHPTSSIYLNHAHTPGSIEKVAPGGIQSVYRPPNTHRSEAQMKIDQLFLSLYLSGRFPLAALTDASFLRFLHLQEGVTPPTPSDIKGVLLPNAYQELKDEVSSGLRSTECVTISIDSYTQTDGRQVLAVNCHFIDTRRQWKWCNSNIGIIKTQSGILGGAVMAILKKKQLMGRVACVLKGSEILDKDWTSELDSSRRILAEEITWSPLGNITIVDCFASMLEKSIADSLMAIETSGTLESMKKLARLLFLLHTGPRERRCFETLVDRLCQSTTNCSNNDLSYGSSLRLLEYFVIRRQAVDRFIQELPSLSVSSGEFPSTLYLSPDEWSFLEAAKSVLAIVGQGASVHSTKRWTVSEGIWRITGILHKTFKTVQKLEASEESNPRKLYEVKILKSFYKIVSRLLRPLLSPSQCIAEHKQHLSLALLLDPRHIDGYCFNLLLQAEYYMRPRLFSGAEEENDLSSTMDNIYRDPSEYAVLRDAHINDILLPTLVKMANEENNERSSQRPLKTPRMMTFEDDEWAAGSTAVASSYTNLARLSYREYESACWNTITQRKQQCRTREQLFFSGGLRDVENLRPQQASSSGTALFDNIKKLASIVLAIPATEARRSGLFSVSTVLAGKRPLVSLTSAIDKEFVLRISSTADQCPQDNALLLSQGKKNAVTTLDSLSFDIVEGEYSELQTQMENTISNAQWNENTAQIYIDPLDL